VEAAVHPTDGEVWFRPDADVRKCQITGPITRTPKSVLQTVNPSVARLLRNVIEVRFVVSDHEVVRLSGVYRHPVRSVFGVLDAERDRYIPVSIRFRSEAPTLLSAPSIDFWVR